MEMAAACRSRTLVVALALAPLAAGCQKRSIPDPQPPDSCEGTPALPPGQAFTISGDVTYDLVPAVYSPTTGTGGLAFDGATWTPVRSAIVEVRQCNTVLATTATDATTGHYSVQFTPAAVGQVAVYVLARTASPPITVRDGANATWAVAAQIADATGTLDVHAPHGWTGTAYGPDRIAAPFAILDTILTAEERLIAVRQVSFAATPVVVNWSPTGGDSYYDFSTREISLAGIDGADTDEFDRGVVAHEWAHWFEDRFSRSDSPGGSHSFGDVLDPRVAFDEGSASALGAMLLQDRIYADTGWVTTQTTHAQDAFGWDAETESSTDDLDPGPFSEMSVLRAVYDLYDGGSSESFDTIALGAGPIYDALVGPQRTTPALTTIASFVAGLKAGVDAGARDAIDAVLAHYRIGAITSEWGDGDAKLRAMYSNIAAPTSTPAPYSVTFDGAYDWNEQPQNRYFVFTGAGGDVTVEAASSQDVDLEGYDAGLFRLAVSDATTESMTFATTPGHVYVVVLNGAGWGVRSYAATATFSIPSP